MERKTFSHAPDEAMSVGLAKACDLRKNLFCWREKPVISLKIKQNEKPTCLLSLIVKYVLILPWCPANKLESYSVIILSTHASGTVRTTVSFSD